MRVVCGSIPVDTGLGVWLMRRGNIRLYLDRSRAAYDTSFVGGGLITT